MIQTGGVRFERSEELGGQMNDAFKGRIGELFLKHSSYLLKFSSLPEKKRKKKTVSVAHAGLKQPDWPVYLSLIKPPSCLHTLCLCSHCTGAESSAGETYTAEAETSARG